MKVYKLNPFVQLFPYAVLSVMTVVGGGSIFATIIVRRGDPGLTGISWLVALGYVWYALLRIPHTIELFDDKTVEFRSGIRKIRIATQDIQSVKANPLVGGYTLSHSQGRVYLWPHMKGFSELLSSLKAANPTMAVQLFGKEKP